ncbi:MAG: hypothetical protein O3C40_22825 [Planctomycetota bacterium]|nr:hypothetical protein [Planctomycetota bacterium]
MATRMFAFVKGLNEQFKDPAALFEDDRVLNLSLSEKQEFVNGFMLMVETVKEYGNKMRVYAVMNGLYSEATSETDSEASCLIDN